MKKVLLESPWKALNPSEQVRNCQYARKCLYDSILRGEAPFASHLIYPQVLNEDIPDERKNGIEIGLLWGKHAEKTVVYHDFGITPGMTLGIQRAITEGREIEYRSIQLALDTAKENLISLASQVCEYFLISYTEFTSSARHEYLTIPRHVYFRVARLVYPKYSLHLIGTIANRNHSTVSAGIKHIDSKLHAMDAYSDFCKSNDINYK